MLLTSVECPKVAAWKSKCQVGVLLNSNTLWDDECYKFAVHITMYVVKQYSPSMQLAFSSSYIIHIIATNKPYDTTL